MIIIAFSSLYARRFQFMYGQNLFTGSAVIRCNPAHCGQKAFWPRQLRVAKTRLCPQECHPAYSAASAGPPQPHKPAAPQLMS